MIRLVPDQNLSTASLNATTATAAIAIGERKTFSIATTGTIHYKLGDSSVAAADATDSVLPTGRHFLQTDYRTHIRLYNPGASAITYTVQSYYNSGFLDDVTSGAAIADEVPNGTAGSILFVGSGPVLSQDNSNFFWDDTNDRLGIGTTSPSATLQATQATAGSEVLRLQTTATNDDPNFKVYQNRVATTDGNATTIQTIAISASNSYLIEARVVGRRTGGVAGTADDGAAYIRRALVTTKTGTVTVNATQDGLTQEDQAGWNATFAVSGTDILVQVTGAADNNVTWHSTVIVSNVGT